MSEEKKVKKFDMPGQTKELDMSAAGSAASEASLTFYQTLHEQRPDSEMAMRWLLQHGQLPEDEAKAVAKRLGKDKKPHPLSHMWRKKV